MPSSLKEGATTPQSHLLMAAALETWAHQLLYVRRVYPSTSFCDSYFLGIRYKANRHPDVVEYISNVVKLAVPALIGNDAVADEFCLEVIDDDDKSTDNGGDTDNHNEESTPAIHLPALNEGDTLDGEELDSPPKGPSSSLAKKLKLSDSEESPPPKKSRKSSSQDTEGSFLQGMKPAILFRRREVNQSSQQSHSQKSQSLSTLSCAPKQNPVTNRKGQHDEAADTGYNIDSLTPNTEPEEDPAAANQLDFKSPRVLEKFTLSFSSPKQQVDNLIFIDLEHLGKKPTSWGTGRFQSSQQRNPKQKDSLQSVLPVLELALRNLILHLSSLKRDRVLPSQTLSFKLLLRMAGGHQQQTVSPDIEKAFDIGSWYPASTEIYPDMSERQPRQPLYQVTVDDAFVIRFNMQRQKQQKDPEASGTRI